MQILKNNLINSMNLIEIMHVVLNKRRTLQLVNIMSEVSIIKLFSNIYIIKIHFSD